MAFEIPRSTWKTLKKNFLKKGLRLSKEPASRTGWIRLERLASRTKLPPSAISKFTTGGGRRILSKRTLSAGLASSKFLTGLEGVISGGIATHFAKKKAEELGIPFTASMIPSPELATQAQAWGAGIASKGFKGMLPGAKEALAEGFKQTGDAQQAISDMLIEVGEGNATQVDLGNLMSNIQTGKFFETDPHQLSPHFHKKEFNQRQSPLGLESFDVSPVLVDKLEELRTAIGNKPIKITSGYRSPEYNKRVGGVPKSQHLEGKGADITVEGLTSTELQKAAKSVGFTFTQTYKHLPHLHVDVRGLASFDPEGTGYDYETARKYDLSPDETGHWPSRIPQTGQLLKGRKHKTWPLTEEAEKKAGYKIIKKDNRYYSVSQPEVRQSEFQFTY